MDIYALLASLLHTAPAEYHAPVKHLPLITVLDCWNWGPQ